jgi:putative serine protease PepD
MSSDRRRGTPRPGRLWTDPRTTEEHQHWLAPAPPPRTLPATEPPAPQRPDPDALRRRRRLLAAIVATMALVGVGLGAVGQALLTDDGGSGSTTKINVSTGGAPAGEKAQTVRAIYAAASPSVVFIRVDRGSSSASGTGFLISDNGTIVTNAHVVEGATTARVRLGDRGRDFTATIVGRDPSSDLAVIRIPASATKGLKPLTLADSDKVKVGDTAVAIGYPLGLDRTVTAGIVSGVGREIQAPNGFQIDEAIQTDAPINPGNSGGPLLDSTGRVIGVNSQIATAGGGGGSVGIGFAVASNTLRDVVPKLTRGETITRAYLGVSTGQRSGMAGAVVGSVVPSGPGDDAGLRAGDVIRAVAGKAITVPDDVGIAVNAHRPGDRIDLQVQRNGATVTIPVTLGTRPDRVP